MFEGYLNIMDTVFHGRSCFYSKQLTKGHRRPAYLVQQDEVNIVIYPKKVLLSLIKTKGNGICRYHQTRG